MDKKIVIMVAVIVIAICLISGGCSTFAGDNSVKAWKELLSLAPETDTVDDNSGTSLEDLLLDNQVAQQDTAEYVVVSLYYVDATGSSLTSEDRKIVKTEGIARQTLQELLKGPGTAEYSSVFPEGTKLLDINIKDDGLCIVDLSSEVRQVKDEKQERLMIYAMVNTLGEFPSIKRVSFMIDGHPSEYIGGYLDLSQPIEPDYTI
ncbi:spore germination protein-like protein [hydrocarbon metagenome]|uniref:Spore germination protein-like protein n=1 Tax=hydrocarbon metagenome TaxID=938273 RepID=A0A0W8E7U0_9ZZZZ